MDLYVQNAEASLLMWHTRREEDAYAEAALIRQTYETELLEAAAFLLSSPPPARQAAATDKEPAGRVRTTEH